MNDLTMLLGFRRVSQTSDFSKIFGPKFGPEMTKTDRDWTTE